MTLSDYLTEQFSKSKTQMEREFEEAHNKQLEAWNGLRKAALENQVGS